MIKNLSFYIGKEVERDIGQFEYLFDNPTENGEMWIRECYLDTEVTIVNYKPFVEKLNKSLEVTWISYKDYYKPFGTVLIHTKTDDCIIIQDGEHYLYVSVKSKKLKEYLIEKHQKKEQVE